MDFSRTAETIAIGRRAALAARDRLAALAAPTSVAATPPVAPPATALPLVALTIDGTHRVNAEALRAEMDLRVGQPVSAADVDRAVTALHGRGDFDRIEVDVTDLEDGRRVHLQLSEAPWAENRVRLGLELYSNFAEANRFSIVALHVADWLNPWGAELRTLARIGSRRGLQSELWQPLGPGSAWFTTARLSAEAGSSDAFTEGLRVARVADSEARAQLTLGRRIPGLGDWRVGFGRVRESLALEIPADPKAGTGTLYYRQTFAQVQTDTLDSLAFPSRGHVFNAQLEWLRGAGLPRSVRSSAAGLMAFRLGEWAGHFYGEAARASGGAGGTLGGYLRLSGTTDGSLRGENLGLARLVMARRMGELPIALGGAVRIGFSLEAGAVGQGRFLRLGNQPDGGWREAGAAFVAVDTRFGPFHFALGGTRNGGSALYLFLGPTW
jgi:NTE family protein